MHTGRVLQHPFLGQLPEAPLVTFTFNGQPIQGRDGEAIAAALWAVGIRVLRYAGLQREPRSLYCGIGHCYECRVTVNGIPNLRACLEPVHPDLTVEGGWDRGGSETDGGRG
jgi:sarcosine oxidase subunit alpha